MQKNAYLREGQSKPQYNHPDYKSVSRARIMMWIAHRDFIVHMAAHLNKISA